MKGTRRSCLTIISIWDGDCVFCSCRWSGLHETARDCYVKYNVNLKYIFWSTCQFTVVNWAGIWRCSVLTVCVDCFTIKLQLLMTAKRICLFFLMNFCEWRLCCGMNCDDFVEKTFNFSPIPAVEYVADTITSMNRLCIQLWSLRCNSVRNVPAEFVV